MNHGVFKHNIIAFLMKNVSGSEGGVFLFGIFCI